MLKRVALLLLLLGLGAAGTYIGLRITAKPLPPMEQATARFEAGDIEAAQRLARGVVATDARNADAHLLLARIGIILADWGSVERQARTLRSLRYDPMVVNPILARSLILQTQAKDALREIPAIAGRPEEQAINQALRGWAYLEMDDKPQARASQLAAAQLAPNNPQVLLQQARLALADDNRNQAKAAVDEVLRVRPNNIEALLLKSQVLMREGDKAAALVELNSAVAASPRSPQLRLGRAGLLIDLDEDELARADVASVLHDTPRDNLAHYDHAVLLLRARQYAEASTEFDKLMGVMDQFPEGYFYRAQAAVQIGNLQSALESVTRMLRLRPKDAKALLLAGQLSLQTQQPSRALELLQALSAERPDDAEAEDMMGRAYFTLGRTSDAVEHFSRAVQLAPEVRPFAAHLAAAQTQFGAPAPPDPAK